MYRKNGRECNCGAQGCSICDSLSDDVEYYETASERAYRESCEKRYEREEAERRYWREQDSYRRPYSNGCDCGAQGCAICDKR